MLQKTLAVFVFVFAFLLVTVASASAATTAALLPTSDGTYTQWSPKSGSVHYTQVDETTCNGDTDFNRETTVGQRDSYGINISSVPNGALINQIDITPCASKNTSGGTSSVFNVFYRLNGANSADAGNYTLTTTTPSVLSITTFSGLSVTKSGATTLEIGGIYSSGNKGVKLSRVQVVITYTIPVPTAPSNLTVTPGSSTTAILNWADNSSDETGFRVERSLNGSTGWTIVGSPSANVTTFTNINLTPQQPYYYRVYAYNAGGNSGNSNTYSINTAIPNNPSNVSLQAATCGGTSEARTLFWQDNAFNEDGYTIEVADDGVNYTFLTNVAANEAEYDDMGTACAYRIRAFNGSGVSDWAEVDTIF